MAVYAFFCSDRVSLAYLLQDTMHFKIASRLTWDEVDLDHVGALQEHPLSLYRTVSRLAPGMPFSRHQTTLKRDGRGHVSDNMAVSYAQKQGLNHGESGSDSLKQQ